ncbi:MAG: hypothetical protein R3B69_02700 [Candidatus Paceibacterota bacterium]
MSKLGNGFDQDPAQCYELLSYFGKKLESHSSDVVLLYTTGLYLNTQDIAYEKRLELNRKTVQHARELRNLIEKKREMIPNAIHFLPIDYVILNSNYQDLFASLKKRVGEDVVLQKTLREDVTKRGYSEAQENFILEEVVVSHIIRQHLVPFPRTLVKNDDWRLIVYPGVAIETDRYVTKQNILPGNSKNPFGSGIYNYKERTYANFKE